MPFKTVLRDLVNSVPGARGAIIADWEGEAVDQVGPMDEYDLRLVGAHKGIILGNLRVMLDRIGNDDLREVIISTRDTQTLVLPITPDYFLVLAGCRNQLLGRARFAARRCVQILRQEID
ncbi:MAG: roadblock/LC7 domain-containing protein [Syntrophotalea acetylenica]|jgi:predicted regulator of Ras-like GTPase activity (Roadblock/LC7/MglB family)|uniref:GTPase-activating protein n=1 Tax=Syntrophotalea acetylenica TaxID=29542 RepID=A0A1L3GH25_SYNAC|nr:roadblock/LC7 domain-containing protein [Syntrophotalea acetylenica]APG25242.1 GTPase-activating protein [Syntrophotalea acetylenica]APG43313.1 GTPase-activating protein [Syntrophotalea acetylenica]MDD4457021.1 roadblock/LC7 domain-containing protein [Syntrophotalea acetylenica]MDY0263402.1 roadblock/LC7 domain-containing protein [Syntrophotalea acetylenica]